jgi:nitrogen regulatory protein PII
MWLINLGVNKMKTYLVKIGAGQIETQDVLGRKRDKDKKYKLIVSATSEEEAAKKGISFLIKDERVSEEAAEKIRNYATDNTLNENYFKNYHYSVNLLQNEVEIIWETDCWY